MIFSFLCEIVKWLSTVGGMMSEYQTRRVEYSSKQLWHQSAYLWTRCDRYSNMYIKVNIKQWPQMYISILDSAL